MGRGRGPAVPHQLPRQPQRPPLLCRAVETFLEGRRGLVDAHILREILTFSDEFSGMRLMDDGDYHRVDIPRRVLEKVTWRCQKARPWDMD